MFRLVFFSFVGLFSGLVYIYFFPDKHVSFQSFLSDYILHPFDFFLGSMAFIVGFLCQSFLMSNAIWLMKMLLRKRTVHMKELFISLTSVSNFVILLYQGLWQTILLFLFSFLFCVLSLSKLRVEKG